MNPWIVRERVAGSPAPGRNVEGSTVSVLFAAFSALMITVNLGESYHLSNLKYYYQGIRGWHIIAFMIISV